MNGKKETSEYSQKWASRSFDDVTSCSQIDGDAGLQAIVMDLFRRATVARIRNHLDEALPVDHVADIGCGVGDWLREYLEFSRRGTGVDISADFLAEARRRLDADVHSGRAELVQGHALDVEGIGEADLICFGACWMYFTDAELERLMERAAAEQQSGQWMYVRASVANPRGARFDTDGGIYRLKRAYDRLFERFGYETLFCEHSATIISADLIARVLPIDADKVAGVLEPLTRALRWNTRDDTAFCNWLVRRQ